MLVLGGGSEIALATVQRMVADRCRTVVLAARKPEDLAHDAERLRSAGATTVDLVGFDSRDLTAHEKLIDEIFDRHGDIDLVLFAFGVLGDQQAFDKDPASAAEAAVTNFAGAISTGLQVAERFRRQGHGTLVFLSSVAGERVRKTNFVYGSTKAGLDGFAQGLGDALSGSGARVMIVRPGFVRSKMTEGLDEAPFATTPEQVASAITTGLARGSEIVWVPPVLRWVFVVFHHLPRPLWRLVSAR
ncbi:MAG: Decaprenylphosphoryl-2-keto-beta-D-erythro-pentose reductase [Acidimicrobiales bacterium]|nr:Decaprenylphosphoryl-2-keto-beta-D-erythro-pentose reductase [Acidimicrobiales bacterium]